MIEQISDLPAGVQGFRAIGKVTKEDYDRVFHPALERIQQQGQRVRLLYHLGPEFEGFTASAAWEDARIGLQYLSLIERCAVVSDSDWVKRSTRVLGAVLPCPVKSFGNDRWQEAVSWVGSASEGASVSHRLLQDSSVLVIEPHGPMRAEDFESIAATVDSWLDAHGSLNGIVVHAPRFPGWENLGGFLRHLGFVRDHHRKVRRLAVAVDGKLAGLLPKLGEQFVAAELKQFPYDQLDDAVAWVSGSSPSVEHRPPPMQPRA